MLTYIRDLDKYKDNQEIALYVRDKDEYLVVSTINVSDIRLMGYATSGEETMAFPGNEKGEIVDWGEVAVATGANSRKEVLQDLKDGINLQEDE